MIDGESEGGDCDEVIYAQDEVNKEESEHNEVDGMKKGADSTSISDAYLKERLVIYNEEDTDG